MKKKLLALLLAAVVLVPVICWQLSSEGFRRWRASADAAGTGQATTAADPAGVEREASGVQSGENDALHFTQEITVKKEKYLKRSAYDAFLARAEKAFLIPGLNQAVIPQGMDYSETTGLLYISGYYKLSDVPSVLFALDPKDGSLQADYRLWRADGSPFVSHVGGVAVSDDTLFVSATLDNDGSYSIAAIPLVQLTEPGGHDIIVDHFVRVPVSPSFLNCSQGMLWVGNFYHPSAGYDLSAELSPELKPMATEDGASGCFIFGYGDCGAALRDAAGEDLPAPDCVFIAPDRIQGMTMTEDGTVLLSQSYGRKNDSTVYLCTPDLAQPDTAVSLNGTAVDAWILDSLVTHSELVAMPMTEALCIGPEGEVLVLFESGAMAYSDGTNRTDHIWRFH